MKLKIYVLTASIAGMLSVIAAFIDYRISLGLLLSAGFSLFNMWLLSLILKAMMKQENGNYAAMATGNVIRFSLLLAVVYVGVKNPQLFNVYGLAAGFILFLGALLIDALSRKGGDGK